MNYADYEKAIKEVGTLREKYLSTAARSSCDKHGWGFNQDSRFSIFKAEVSLDSWVGWYGNSSCTTPGDIANKDLFVKYFVKWLDRHSDRMLSEIADMMEKDSLKAKEKRIEELQTELERLQQ